jgi:hypothetical protein
MNYNGVGPWDDAVVSLKIEESRSLGGLRRDLAGQLLDLPWKNRVHATISVR